MKIKVSVFISLLILHFGTVISYCQGYNHTWLLGHTSNKMRIDFTDTSFTLIPEVRKMTFRDTEGNISNTDGNFLMSSNGIWISNATGDTMLNGTGLNPGSFVNSWPLGLPLPNANLIIPWPGDSTRFALFHHTATFDGVYYPSYNLFMSIIDLSLDGGLGGVISKNDTILQDTLLWSIGAVKHANGRDWWIFMLKNSSDIIYKLLLTPDGVIAVISQNLNLLPLPWGTVTQLTFSSDGEKFAYSNSYYQNNIWYLDVRLLDFDRCSGNFNNGIVITIPDSIFGTGVAFSPNSKYLYATSAKNIFQINIDTSDIQASVNLVAQNDTFYSPFPPFQANFDLMYLAANGKIYVTSSNAVVDLHYISSPDSAGLSCNVQQHAINLPGFNFRTVPNHPNYYLGALQGSPCDSLTGFNEPETHEFNFNLTPNPVIDGSLKIIYLLPQNKDGVFEIFDVTGKKVYQQSLPPWSTLQYIPVLNLNNGIYNAVITSNTERSSKKLVILH